METPICDFVKKYASDGTVRLHMPGHKGVSSIGAEPFDITEIDGADVLYSPNGIIRLSEENAASLFSCARTLFSTEGSSLSIRAMLYLALIHAKENGKQPTVAAERNAHKVFLSAAALLDLNVSWIYPERRDSIVSCEISPSALDAFLDKNEVCAVYITSPDYLGNIADIKGLSEVCESHGALLLVDNAHGAYLNFLSDSLHPIALGAHACADSAHKTLPVLTGGAYLHISKKAPRCFFELADSAMSLFASTSPSYIILQSLDMANRYIANGYRERLAAFTKKVKTLRCAVSDIGYTLIGSEPLKLTLAPKSYGYTGEELAALLREKNIVCEFYDRDFLVLMLTPESGNKALDTLLTALRSIPKRAEITETVPYPERAKSVLSI